MRDSPKRLIHVPNAAGADEAGRGPLAGPVVAAAVVLPDGFDIAGIDDSKKLDAKTREELAVRIRSVALFAVERADPDEIDRLNILWASMAAMERSLFRLSPCPTYAYIDGNRLPRKLPCKGEAVVKGDGKYACIAAASILAKVERDRIMTEYAIEFPEFGFEHHFGYPTPDHLEALRKHGPCPIHRRTFGPVRDFDQPGLF
ncbi:MAG: ribonuclease HII [Fimbriimonas sp.]|nr:ribonuclease HII [Fimbriimonas sp.]